MQNLLRDVLDVVSMAGVFWLCFRVGFFPIVLGEIAMFSGVIAAMLVDDAGVSYALGLSGALASGGVLLFVVNMVVLYPLVRRGYRMPQVLAGLGANTILVSVSGLLFGIQSRTIVFGTGEGLTDRLILSEWLLIAVVVTSSIIMDGFLGRYHGYCVRLRAIGDSIYLAQVRGCRTGLVLGTLSALCGGWAGLIGFNMAAVASVRSGSGLNTLLLAFAAVLISGATSLRVVYSVAASIGISLYLLSRVAPPWVAFVSVLSAATLVLYMRGIVRSREAVSQMGGH